MESIEAQCNLITKPSLYACRGDWLELRLGSTDCRSPLRLLGTGDTRRMEFSKGLPLHWRQPVTLYDHLNEIPGESKAVAPLN